MDGRAGRLAVHGANLRAEFDQFGQRSGINAQFKTATLEGLDDNFGGNISYQLITREGASAQAADRAVEPVASRIISGQNFLRGALAAAVQVDSDFYAVAGVAQRRKQIANLLSACFANRV